MNIIRCLWGMLVITLLVSITELKAQITRAPANEKAVVVTADRVASKVGRTILQQGGNAVDAAVAVQFALAVTTPRAGNIGGGGFMMIRMQGDSSVALDFREVAPREAHEDMYIRDGKYRSELSRKGILAVGVPGVVDGMVKAMKRYGDLSLEKVMKPAIQLARNGFRLTARQADRLNRYADELRSFPASEEYFIRSDNTNWQQGDLLVQRDLAATLERIAEQGRKGFYQGKTANMIVRTMEKYGGLIDYRDLRQYSSKWRKPVRADYRGYKLHMMPPPSSGGVAIGQMLQMLEPYDLKEIGVLSTRYVHLLTEVMRRAFADRAHFLGDPDFASIPTQKLLEKAYNHQRMKSFEWNHASNSDSLSHGEIPGFSESRQTTHFSIVDSAGNGVSVTTTLNGNYGSKVSVKGAGFLLNNEMNDFTARPGEPNMFGLIQGKVNAIEPQKRMLSSMTPTLVTQNNDLRMVLGAAGGPRIINAILQCFLNIAVFDMDVMQAVAHPRFHHQWLPDQIVYEIYGFNPKTRQLLRKMGHQLKKVRNVGRAHIIYVGKNGSRYGGPDPRRNGAALGY